VRLLEGRLNDPDREWGDVPLLTAEERERVLSLGWEPELSVPPAACVHHWFTEQAARTPDACAVVGGGARMTYRVLNERADALAARLRKCGVGRETLVGLFVERSPELVVALLAVWKAGGAYVPLDPAYPAERIRVMIETAGLDCLLTGKRLRDEVPLSGLQVVCLEEGDEEEAVPPMPLEAGTGQDLAYVMFTSGSTGTPKGVQIEHRTVVQFLHAMRLRPGIRPDDVMLSVTTLSFDISVLELWLPLVSGASVVIASRDEVVDGAALAALLERHEATMMQGTPATWRLLLEAGWEGSTQLQVLCGGEELPADLAGMLAQRSAALWNLYGPTEATVWAAADRVDPARPISIGRPIAGTRLYVLDSRLEPVPPGMTGELYIGGAGLARGYLGRPDLTAEKFVSDPFAEGRQARMYASGDLARWRPDGTLECVGRIDQQVKVRGFRIELGEIESCLAGDERVQEAAAAVHTDLPGGPLLAAYVVLRPQGGQEVGGTQEELLKHWGEIFDSYYEESAAEGDPLFNIGIWSSSYTRQPIPLEEMKEWVACTVDRLLAFRPQTVLEMGCGTGLLLYRIAPHVRAYVGGDLSGQALARIREQIAARPGSYANVTLEQRAADQYAGVAPASQDLVVLNSVVQYFPSAEYLADALQGAVRAARPGGQVFVGDVRDYRLLERFHASIEEYQAEEELSPELLQERVRSRVAKEGELVVDPAFFRALAARLPEIGHVEVRVKRGRFRNEMSCYRYDVVLHIGAVDVRDAEFVLDGRQAGRTVEEVRRCLTSEQPESLAVVRLPNGRLAGEEGIDPEVWYELGAETGYAVEVLVSVEEASWCDAVFVRAELAAAGRIVRVPGPAVGRGAPDEPLAWNRYANRPLRVAEEERLVDELASRLREKLPAYMVPDELVVLERMPRTLNGKRDRRALPVPERRRRSDGGDGRKPSSPVEELVAQTLGEALRLDVVPLHASFLAIGGHSLLATRVTARLRELFQVDVPVRELMEASSLACFAAGVTERMRDQTVMQAPPLRRLERSGDLLEPSSPQTRLWLADRMQEGKTPFYNIPLLWLLRGKLNLPAIEQSLHEIVRRHEALRTVFPHVGGRPMQKILPAAPMPLPVQDLRALPDAEKVRRREEQMRKESHWCFDLTSGPLFRAELLRTEEREAYLFLNMHHIVSDGLSLVVLEDEFLKLYESFAKGAESPLPELPIQYADYAAWQNAWLRDEVLAEKLAYWTKRLGGALPRLELPTDRPRGPKQTYRGTIHAFELAAEEREELYAFARKEGFTPFMVLMAAYKLLLHLWTGETDLLVGSPVANREQGELKGMIGFFINTVVYRTNLGADPTLREVVQRFRETAYEAYAHQDAPYEKLVEKLQPERDPRFPPLYQVWFVMHNTPVVPVQTETIELVPQLFDNGWAQVDLGLAIEERANTLGLVFTYNCDLFEAKTVGKMAELYRTTLRNLIREPDLRIGGLRAARQRQVKESRLAKLKKGAVPPVATLPVPTKGDTKR